MKIGVILPSRGLIYADTLKELLRELKGKQYKIFFSHNNPIPDCFNKPLEKAYKDRSITHLWFVEEDMVLPEGVLDKLIEANAHAVACDYPLTQEPSGTVIYDPKGKAYFTGTGCLLVERKSFRQTVDHFRADILWRFGASDNGIVFKCTKDEQPEKAYGYHDITMGLQYYISGKPIEVIDVICYQRKLVNLGTDNTNQGTHSIKLFDNYKRQSVTDMTKTSKEPLNGDLIEVYDFNLKKKIYIPKDGLSRVNAVPTAYKFGSLTLDFSDNVDMIKEIIK